MYLTLTYRLAGVRVLRAARDEHQCFRVATERVLLSGKTKEVQVSRSKSEVREKSKSEQASRYVFRSKSKVSRCLQQVGQLRVAVRYVFLSRCERVNHVTEGRERFIDRLGLGQRRAVLLLCG